MSKTSRCTACGEVKPASEFTPSSQTKDGCTPRCRPCNAAYMREWRARTETPEKRAERNRRARERYTEERLELAWFREKFPGLARKKPWLAEQ